MIVKNSTKRIELINRYYKITRFYPFLKDIAIKGGITIIIFAIIVLGLELFVLDINTFLNHLVTTYSPQIIFSFFLVSETALGLIPPEAFIAWASKSHPGYFYFYWLQYLM